MSFLFLLFYWVALPLIIVFAVVALLRLNIGRFFQGIVVTVGLAAASWLLWIAVGETWMLDRQVRELCAEDGGGKVYETVKLSSDKFNEWGQPNFYKPIEGENALGREYIFKQTINYLLKGNPSLHKYHVQIYLRNSGKLLGETIGYSRGGGGFPGPWKSQSFSCPSNYSEVLLITKIFILNGD